MTILQIYVYHFKVRPGETLGLKNFISTVLTKQTMRAADLEEGLAYAVQVGWLTVKRPNESWALTDEGFKAA